MLAKSLNRIGVVLILLFFSISAAWAETNPIWSQASSLFKQASFDKTREAVDLLANSSDPQAPVALKALLEGQLYQHKQNDSLAIIVDSTTVDVSTGQTLSTVNKDSYRKIPVNNTLRKLLRSKIGGLSLSSPDPKVRLASATGLLETVTPEQLPQLQELLGKETDPQVKDALNLALQLAALNGSDQAEKLTALKALEGNLNPIIRNKLASLTSDADTEIAKAAQSTLRSIESKVILNGQLETLFFGLSLGSVLVLAAIGLAITFGVMGVINMAHGELIMLGAYTTYFIQRLMPNYLDYSLFLAIPAAFIVSGLMGILIERTVIRHLYGRPLETLLATFGISLILQQLVRTVVSPQNVPVSNPSWMSGSLEINSLLSLTYNRLYILAFSLLVFAILYFVLRNTSLGLQVRAVSQNRAMARAMGVRSARVDALTFGLGSGIAGVAGVALSQLTNVGPNLGQSYIIDSFMVVVFGGVGNLWGTLVAGLSLGVINKFLEPWAGAVLAKILVLVFIILFIQKRPRGLFPQKGRAAGD
ncbi:urea ABC transporter permease subunit UrtB [uncultured Thiothrix sp.]|uniref:urea ABC transporter permease subunit UrtB n=1 Tax=uncultured Thiothrix sp. TaxID=223185 RepID=UPI002634A585|nr:urea ABC transporter permease subunit UrtB [uncultured Thiothrix sp.]HMT94683.1 urea ABC transporter permease subunit UrtB [Thiolinea sp.]